MNVASPDSSDTNTNTHKKEHNMSTASKAKQEEAQEARDYLLSLLSPGDQVGVIVRWVNRGGDSRRMSVIVGLTDVTWAVCRVMGKTFHPKYGTITMGGCGMDMTFALAYDLSVALWPEGYPCKGDRDCPSNSHVNGDDYGQDVVHKDGYALGAVSL